MASDDDRGASKVEQADTLPSDPRDDTLPSEPRPSPAPRLDSDEFEVEELLGRGGMGEVYLAQDRHLNRRVALKILHAAGPDFTRDLMHEAQAQARVEHANICKVYGVRQLPDGRPFIVLQYIEGGTLRAAAAGMTREERVRVVHDVAEGLHAAHRLGLVHRDVKPANILVEQTLEGYKPYITDFGLARIIDAPTLTQTGVTKGTPAYMAPEQARADGQDIDRRTDVYALGVVLYELLTGRLPFVADSGTGIIWKLLNDDAPAPRSLNPAIPIDLETIAMKCMEKEPARRYDSARAVAEDLQAWLDGNPIQARSAGVRYRLRKWARKRRVALAFAGLVASMSAAMVGYEVRARRIAAEQAHAAQAFGEDVERNDAISRYAALLPLHDTRRERRMIEAGVATIERRMTALGPRAEGPGRYGLGRGYLALERIEDARRELERAWQLGYHAPEVSYALGVVYGVLYQRALDALVKTDEAEEEPQRRAALERELRDPALLHLKASTGLQAQAPEYVEALIALHEHRYEDALAKARAARARVPWLYEALIVEAEVHAEQANDARFKSDLDRAIAAYQLAGDAYRAAIDMAHSSDRALRGRCVRLAAMVQVMSSRDRAPEEAAQQALAACGDALTVAPGDAALYTEEARIWMSLARYADVHNGDARSAWQQAIALGARAVAAAPNDVSVLLGEAQVDRFYAEYLKGIGEDPRPYATHAIKRTEQVLATEPRNDDALILLSGAAVECADWETDHGLDARATYDKGIAAGRRAAALPTRSVPGAVAMSYAQIGKLNWQLEYGVDPAPDARQAIATCEAVLKENAGADSALSSLCFIAETVAQFQVQAGVDPTAELVRSRDYCQRSSAASPNWAGSAVGEANLAYIEAEWKLDNRADPTALLERGRLLLRRALEIDASYDLGHRTRGDLALLAARWAILQQRSPESELAAARAAYSEALKRRRTTEALTGLAEVSRRRAEWRAAHGQSAEDDVQAGLRNAEAALAVNPRFGPAALEQGALHLVRARRAPAHAAPRAGEARAARDAFARALAFNPNLARMMRPLSSEAEALR